MAVLVPRIGSGASGGIRPVARLALLLRTGRRRRGRRRRRTPRPRSRRPYRRRIASWRCARRWRKRARRRSSIRRRRRSRPICACSRRLCSAPASFSDAFRRTVWATPELDYTLKRPVGALAKRLWSDERREDVAASLARLGERYGLNLSRPPGLRRLPGVRPAAEGVCRASWSRRAGGVADGRTARRLARGGAGQRAGPKARPRGTPVPAVVLYDTKTKKVLPVGFGVMAEDQLAERIFTLTALEPGNDY